MDFKEVITDFATRHNVSGLEAEDGTAALDIDGIVVLLLAVDGGMILSAEIGEPPVEGKSAFADMLLEANLESAAFFAKNHETGKYVVARRLVFAMLSAESFDTALEGFVNMAETWKKLLEDFRPVAAHAAAEKDDMPSFGAGGFMQV